MPKRLSACYPFSLPDLSGDYATYRLVLVSCGKHRCRNDRHGPYMYARVKTLAGRWKETYMGTLDSAKVQALLRRAARRNASYEKFLLRDEEISR